MHEGFGPVNRAQSSFNPPGPDRVIGIFFLEPARRSHPASPPEARLYRTRFPAHNKSMVTSPLGPPAGSSDQCTIRDSATYIQTKSPSGQLLQERYPGCGMLEHPAPVAPIRTRNVAALPPPLRCALITCRLASENIPRWERNHPAACRDGVALGISKVNWGDGRR